MAEETGIVLSSTGGKARIRLNRKSECSTCGGCFFSKTERFMVAEVEDTLGVQPGDSVMIANRTSATKAGFLLYVLPLFVLVGGYAAGTAVAGALGATGTDGWGIAAGFVLMALGYFVLYRAQKRAARRGPGPMRLVRLVSGAAQRRPNRAEAPGKRGRGEAQASEAGS